MVAHLKDIEKVMGIDTLTQQILPVIVELSEDQKWRIREKVIESIPTLTKNLGKSVFDQKLYEIVICALNDNIYKIRESAGRCLCELVSNDELGKVFGIFF